MKNDVIRSRITLVIFCIVATFVSCNQDSGNEVDGDVIHVEMNPSDLPPFSKLSEIVKEIRIVPLETNPECIMSYISRLFIGEKDIILTTMAGMNWKMFHFDTDGKYLNSIGKQGRGPEEFTDLWELTVFEDSRTIYAGTQRSRNIYKYSFEGDFLDVIEYPKGLSRPKVLSPDRIAYTSLVDHEVRIIDNIKQDTQLYIPITPNKISDLRHLTGYPHYGYFYSALGRDTIWRIEPDSMRPAIVCDFGTGHISSQEYFGSMREPGGYPPGRLSIGGGILHGSGYYHFSLLREDEEDEYLYARVILNENTGKVRHFDSDYGSDDILFSDATNIATIATNGEWVSFVSAIDLIEALPKIKGNDQFEYSPELIDQISKLEAEDNPVLVFLTLK